ncbi:MAG TPA: small ribosomal subunit biogenesis GTPase RsgA [Gammaproteobacteria bacterium]|nr:small ribosomal subunit biogenesis GTPase RsgA [Gammaproteobacteria bacterium]
MAKRKLNRRQAWRAEKVQQERRARAEKKSAKLSRELEGSELGPEQPGRIITRFGASVDLEDSEGKVHRCLLRQNLPPLVCGDRVIWQQASTGNGVVVAMEPRKTLLERPNADGQLKPVAANIDQIIVVAAPLPALDLGLIDRYLVAAELTGIPPVLLINKVDLLDDGLLDWMRERVAVYSEVGYPVLFASTYQEQGLEALKERLKDHTSIFVGQSGVGKSSLINALMPGQDIRVGELSDASGLGKHTTTTTVLYHFPEGGELIDSPGVRAFGLDHATRNQIADGFVEFRPYLGQCKFNDCRHTVEPGCAIQAAIEEGAIQPERFKSYLQIVESLDD